MSHASARHTSPTSQPTLDDLLGFGLKLLSLSLDTLQTVIQQAPRFPLQLPTVASLRPPDPCAIPETPCPPRCVCDVVWQASPGETPELTLRVTNASKTTRTFALQATPFTGAGGTPGTLTVAPSSLTLAPRQVGMATAKFTVPNVPEGEYQAEIVVSGAYEQCVRVRLHVRNRKTCGDEHCVCDVVQGDPPVRIRAHHWYHHFQCTEPCVDDRGQHRPDHDH
jgi:hypothetical protein